MPILGIMASQISGKLWQPDGAFDSLATVTVPSGGVASVTFAGIPSTYKHLQIRGIGRSTRAINIEAAWIYFNNDTSTSTYVVHGLSGDGASASAYAVVPTAGGIQSGLIPGSTATASSFGGFVIDILDYTNTTKNTTVRSLTGTDLNGSGIMRLISGLWLNTAAINSIKLDTQGGGNFTEYTQFSLYGIK